MAVCLSRVLLCIAVLAPLGARADVRLLDEELRAPDLRTFALLQDPQAGGDAKKGSDSKKDGGESRKSGADAASSGDSSLDFDLLGDAKAPPIPPEDRSMARRRTMLGVHQAIGVFALVPLQLATTVVGQLNYNDKFGDANTGRYKLPHQILAYSTLAVFATNGVLALLAPGAPAKPDRGLDRVTLHKISMLTAAVGMATQAGLGIYTANREGYQNKQDFGRAHLVVGYVTLAAVMAGVSAIVF